MSRMGACYISIDDQKERIAGYSPGKAEEFHTASAKLADKLFEEKLKTESAGEVILLCGGSASGKTEFYSEYLADQACIVFDSTLSTIEGATIKLRKIQKAKKTPVVVAVVPDDVQRSFKAFLGRERTFSAEHFYRTHSGSRNSLLWIAQEYPSIEIRLYESAYRKKGTLRFRRIAFRNRRKLIEYLTKIQYTETQISDSIFHHEKDSA